MSNILASEGSADLTDLIQVNTAFETVVRKLIKKGFVDRVLNISLPFGTKRRYLEPLFERPHVDDHGDLVSRISVRNKKFTYVLAWISKRGVKIRGKDNPYAFSRSSFGRAVNEILLLVMTQDEADEYFAGGDRCGGLHLILNEWNFSVNSRIREWISKRRRQESEHRVDECNDALNFLHGIRILKRTAYPSTRCGTNGSTGKMALETSIGLSLTLDNQALFNTVLEILEKHLPDYVLPERGEGEKPFTNKPVLKNK